MSFFNIQILFLIFKMVFFRIRQENKKAICKISNYNYNLDFFFSPKVTLSNQILLLVCFLVLLGNWSEIIDLKLSFSSWFMLPSFTQIKKKQFLIKFLKIVTCLFLIGCNRTCTIDDCTQFFILILILCNFFNFLNLVHQNLFLPKINK